MSSRLLLRASAARPASSLLPYTRRRITQTSTLCLKESASTDPNPEDFEKHKQDSLSKQKRGEGHWKPELASVSEETIKAERMSPEEASEAALKRLQDQTKGRAEELLKQGTSMKDNM